MPYNVIAADAVVKKTAQALEKNGAKTLIVPNKNAAKEKVLALLAKDAEVMTMSSITLEQTGIHDAIESSNNYKSVRKTFETMATDAQADAKQKLGAAPQWAIGSVHAVTQSGELIIASNTGSQLPAYAYGSEHVIWVVGTQKIVKNFDDGLKRIDEYVLPLESERVKKAYGMPRSNVSKLLVINKEIKPDRLTVIFVEEVLGF